MSSSIRKDGMPSKDPYKVLGVSSTASESDIKKAYRQLALKLHPDKQSGTLTDAQREELDKKFHDIKDARSFLLDAEHADARKKYDVNLASERVRHAEEEKREKTMSSRRKRMREELNLRERMAGMAKSGDAKPASSGEDRFDVDRLRREGERLREEYSKREAEVDAARAQQAAVERATQQLQKEDRQVRLKWSRKKVTGGIHTKQSLTSIMKDFGEVEEVEMLGSKGNAALITFSHESSCKPCVDAYSTSDVMRATFVGRKKFEDNAKGGYSAVDDRDAYAAPSEIADAENLEDRKLRQAAERERLMRQMEMEEAGLSTDGQRVDNDGGPNVEYYKRGEDGTDQSKRTKSTFPPKIPCAPGDEALGPFQLLPRSSPFKKYTHYIPRTHNHDMIYSLGSKS